MAVKFTKEEYSQRINGSSVYFVDKEKDYELYRTERSKLLQDVFEYYRHYVFDRVDWRSFGGKLIEETAYALEHYDATKGTFLQFLTAIVRRKSAAYKWERYTAAKQNTAVNDGGGIKISKDMRASLVKLKRYAEEHGLNFATYQDKLCIAKGLNKTVKEIDSLLVLGNLHTVSAVVNEEGEETSVYDTLADETGDFETQFVDKDSLTEYIDVFEDVFRSRQERSKPVIAMVLTLRFLRMAEGNAETVKRMIAHRNFYSKQVIELYESLHRMPLEADIAQILQKKPESISRTMSAFLQECKKLKSLF